MGIIDSAPSFRGIRFILIILESVVFYDTLFATMIVKKMFSLHSIMTLWDMKKAEKMVHSNASTKFIEL